MDEFQRECARTHGDREHLHNVLTHGLGLAGEAGEVCDLLKKTYGHGHELQLGRLRDELGDVLWYVAALCTTFGLSLADVAQANADKLRRRDPLGFGRERSIHRETEAA